MEQLLNQRGVLGQLLTRFTDQHPDVISARNRIVQAEEALAALPSPELGGAELLNPVWSQLNAELDKVELDIASINTRTEQTHAMIEELSQRVADSPGAEAELIHLTRDYQIMVKQYEKLIERRESARMGQRLGAEADSVEFRVVEPPRVPVKASGPPRLILLGVVLVFGCGAGVGAAIIRILLTDAFMGSRQLAKAIGLPVIGVLPVTRSVLSARRKMADAAAASFSVVLLFGFFVGLAAFFIANPAPPSVGSMVKNLVKVLG
jgi:uncharacterized protein involved in exopolysaccharide biosynthesis